MPQNQLIELLLRQDGELPVLPLSVYGSVATSHSEVSEEYSSPDQFFFYLYDKSYVSPSCISNLIPFLQSLSLAHIFYSQDLADYHLTKDNFQYLGKSMP